MTIIDESMIDVAGLRAYLSRPRGGSGAGMLLLPMATGIGQQVREFAQDIADAGLTAMSWDPWHGPSTDNTLMETLISRAASLDDETCLREMRVLLDHMIGALGVERVGVIGWCLGGRFALLLAARDKRLTNVVAYHPTVPTPRPPYQALDAAEQAEQIGVPAMVLYPKADSIVSWDSYARLRDALESRAVGPSILHVYPDAEHGFSAKARHNKVINAEAQAICWPQVLAFCRATTSVR